MEASAADLKFLHRLRQTHFRNFKSKSGTRIICLLVPLCFRSSCDRVPRCITNFGSGALVHATHYRGGRLPSEWVVGLLVALARNPQVIFSKFYIRAYR